MYIYILNSYILKGRDLINQEEHNLIIIKKDCVPPPWLIKSLPPKRRLKFLKYGSSPHTQKYHK